MTYLLVRLFALQSLDSSHLTHGLVNFTLLTKGLDLLRATLNSKLDFRNFPHLHECRYVGQSAQSLIQHGTYQVRGLRVLLWGLFQPPVCRSDPPVALIHEGKYVGLVLGLEACKDGVAGIRFARGEELGLQTFGVRLGACAEVHFLGRIALARNACAER